MVNESGLKRLKAELADMEARLKVYEENMERSRNDVDEYDFWFSRTESLKQEIKNKREFIWDIED